MKGKKGSYQRKGKLYPPVCGSSFCEDGDGDGPGEEDYKTLDAVEDDLGLLEEVVCELHLDNSAPAGARSDGVTIELEVTPR